MGQNGSNWVRIESFTSGGVIMGQDEWKWIESSQKSRSK